MEPVSKYRGRCCTEVYMKFILRIFLISFFSVQNQRTLNFETEPSGSVEHIIKKDTLAGTSVSKFHTTDLE